MEWNDVVDGVTKQSSNSGVPIKVQRVCEHVPGLHSSRHYHSLRERERKKERKKKTRNEDMETRRHENIVRSQDLTKTAYWVDKDSEIF